MSGLDPDDVRSYRLILNLAYMSMIIERLVYKQLTDYLEKHSLLPINLASERIILRKLLFSRSCWIYSVLLTMGT